MRIQNQGSLPFFKRHFRFFKVCVGMPWLDAYKRGMRAPERAPWKPGRRHLHKGFSIGKRVGGAVGMRKNHGSGKRLFVQCELLNGFTMKRFRLIKDNPVVIKGFSLLHRHIESRMISEIERHGALIGIGDFILHMQGISINGIGISQNKVKRILTQCLLTVPEFHDDFTLRMGNTGELAVSGKSMIAGMILLSVNVQHFVPGASNHRKQGRIAAGPERGIPLPEVFHLIVVSLQTVHFRRVLTHGNTQNFIFHGKDCHLFSLPVHVCFFFIVSEYSGVVMI